MIFTGKTKNIGIIGYPVEHSLSPAMQNAALEAAELDYAYIAMPVEPSQLETAIKGIRALNFRGANVTIPHKQTVIPFLDEISPDAKGMGSVNTIVNENGKLIGHNTDAAGFIYPLDSLGFYAESKTAVMLGAGGASRAIIWGLAKEKAASISIGVRNAEKAKPIAEYFKNIIEVNVFHWDDPDFQLKVKSADLIVNATPLGMAPHVEASPPLDWDIVSPESVIYDIIYNPQETLFLRNARAKRCHTLNGEGMLIGQGAESFKLWTGISPHLPTMKKALRQALAQS